jgi:aminotransferase
MINVFQPSLDDKELGALKEVFESNWVGRGSKTDNFIERLSNKINKPSKFMTTTTCCTEGVFQIMDLLDIQKGDEVVLPSISFNGVANAIVYKNATPVFCDVDKHTLNPTVEDIEKKITPKTKVVIVIHYAGVPCDIDNIAKLCKERDIVLVEDNANSPFSKYNNQNTGTFGDFGVWSFDAMKVMTTGDGGLIYSKNEDYIDKLNKLIYLGLETSSGLSSTIDKKWWQFEVSVPGRRSIMNDITSAIGIEQLKKVDGFIQRRKEIHNIYNSELDGIDWITTPTIKDEVKSSYFMYHIQLKERDELAKYLRLNEIYTTFRYYPLHWVEFYKSKENLSNTDYAASHTLCIPAHQSLTNLNLEKIISSIKEFK